MTRAVTRAVRPDALLIGFHETAFPPALASLPPEHPLGHYYQTNFLRLGGRELDTFGALSLARNVITGRDDYYHWSEAAPLALHYLTSFLRRRGLRVEVFRLFEAEHARLSLALEVSDPRAVCILTTYYTDPWPILDMINFVRRRNPRTKIILGGPFVHDIFRIADERVWKRRLEILGADIFVRCTDGEQTLARVLFALRSGEDLSAIPNLALLERGKFIGLTPLSPEENDLNEGVDWDQLSREELGRAVYFRTSAGCAFSCAFCEFPVRAGSLRLAELDAVEAQLSQLARRGVEHVSFIDDTFNVPLPRFVELCRRLRDNFSFRWSSHFRATNGRRPELFELMRQSGCVGLHLGIESGDEAMLARMDKFGNLDHYDEALAACHRHGIFTHAAIIIGFPGETARSIENTINFLNRAQPTTFKAQPFYYLRHTPIAERAEEFQLQGEGWSWSHSTMSSGEAIAAAAEIRRAVRGPVFSGDRSVHPFMVPWMLSLGIGEVELVEVLRALDRLQRVSFDPATAPAQVARAELDRVCAGLGLAPSIYSFSAVDRLEADPRVAEQRREYLEAESKSAFWARTRARGRRLKVVSSRPA